MSEDFTAPIRLVNFVSEDQLDTAKKTRGARVEDGTAQRDRPLFEILKENKDKQDAEFNERFKHRPPKALDEDETEFLDKLESSKKEYERHLEAEEAQQLRSFQAAVAAQAMMMHEVKEMPRVSDVKEDKPAARRKNPSVLPPSLIIKAKPQAKKVKTDPTSSKPSELAKTVNGNVDKSRDAAQIGLVSYSDESEEDD